MRRGLVLMLVLAVIGSLAGAARASAAAPATSATQDGMSNVAVPMYPVSNPDLAPNGFAVTPGQAVVIAEHSGTALEIHRTHHPLQYAVWVWAGSHYEIYFAYHGTLLADVIVRRGGGLGPTYTGPLISGIYARGNYDPAFDSPWVFLPFGLLFLLPLATRRPGLAHLDVAMLLSFGISYVLFNTRHTEAGVWLAYPPLLYLMARMLWRGRAARAAGRPLRSALPTAVLAGGLLLLVAARIFFVLHQQHVIDVGYASVTGATRILHGQSPYYLSVAHGDTYGPIAYLAYTPFAAIWPGSWSSLPAARAATITFDLLTIGGLLLIGTRLRNGSEGRRLGLTLAWLWAACPFSLLGVIKGTNDGLIALMMVLLMLSLSAPLRRGVILGLAAAAKFVPAILLPLMLTGRGGDEKRGARKVAVAFVITVGASIALFLPPGGLKEMYDHTIGYQLSRQDIFSPWALHPGLAPVKILVEIAVVALALLLAVRPRGPRSLPQVSALSAALMIAVQLPATHWFYFYIVWFLPLVLIAALGAEQGRASQADDLHNDISAARESASTPVLAGVG